MDKLKQWVALTMLGVIVIAAAEVRTKAAQQVSANSALQTQIQVLKSQAKELPAQQAKLAAVAAKIPDNPALPTLIRALTVAATDAGVELVSLAPGQPAALAAAAPVAPVAAPAATGNAAVVAPAAAGSSAGVLQSIGLSINVVGSYFQVEQFLDRVESLSRALKVTAFTVAPGSNPLKPTVGQVSADTGSSLNASITGTVYMASGRPTAVAGK